MPVVEKFLGDAVHHLKLKTRKYINKASVKHPIFVTGPQWQNNKQREILYSETFLFIFFVYH